MNMSELDPIREAIREGWAATITFDTMGPLAAGPVAILSATEAYVAYEESNGDHVVVPWWQIESIRINQGAKRR